MATYTTTLYDKQTGPHGTGGGHKADALYAKAKLRFAVCEYRTKGTEAAGDIVNLTKLPSGVLPAPALSRIVHRVGSPSLEINIGVASDPKLYVNGAKLSGAKTNVAPGHGQPDFGNFGLQYDKPRPLKVGDEVVFLEFPNGVTAGKTNNLTFYLAYFSE